MPPRSNRRKSAPTFANPDILGEPLEEDFEQDPNATVMKLDPRSTGRCDQTPEADACHDLEVIEEMEFEEWATWLGKWFAHHYAAWVSEFDMKELENYDENDEARRDSRVGPLLMLCWTFRRFRVPDDEWRSPAFCSPVWCPLFRLEINLTSF